MKENADMVMRPDAKGRITLGALARGISSYLVHSQPDGRLILEPRVEIPAQEAWLFRNPEALANVRKGLQEAGEGKLKSRGSFAEYAEEA